jgi:DNA (cytosine-5)-methyltransferase 1
MPQKNSYITATDQFCGAGGSTTGAKKAGVEVKMALNHWQLAIETHNTNHPEVEHDCTDVQACDPRYYPSTNILITSPECTNHSLAKGQRRNNRNQLDIFEGNKIKAEHERSRATMWDVVRFAEYHQYELIFVENVVDARKWHLFDAWLMAMDKLGYAWVDKYLNSMFFNPCPQSRDRMYIVFYKKGNKKPDLEHRPKAPCPQCGVKEAYQSFKQGRAYGKYKSQYIYRCSGCYEVVTPFYYCAMNAIDWTVPITRIGDRKRPLVKKTMDRIKWGLERYKDKQMIVTGSDSNYFQLSQVQIGTMGYGNGSKPAHLPLSTQTTRQDHYVVTTPAIVELRGTSKTRPADEALSTFTAGGFNHGLLISGHSGGWTRTLDQPTGTFTTSTPQALLAAGNINSFLTYYYGSNNASHISEAIHTVTTIDRASLNIPAPKPEDCYYRCLKAHEVQKAMAFPDDYIVLGDSKKKVKQLGNAVTPPVMEWLVSQGVKSLEE